MLKNNVSMQNIFTICITPNDVFPNNCRLPKTASRHISENCFNPTPDYSLVAVHNDELVMKNNKFMMPISTAMHSNMV